MMLQDSRYYVTCMHSCGDNLFKWPKRVDKCWYTYIFGTLDVPVETEKGLFKLSDESYDLFEECEEYV